MKKEAQKKAEPEVILSQHDPFVCRCGLGIDWGLVWRSIEDVVMEVFLGCWLWWNPRKCPSIPKSSDHCPLSVENQPIEEEFSDFMICSKETRRSLPFTSFKEFQTWHLIELNSQPWCRCCIHCIALLSLEHNLTSFQRLVDLTLPKLLFDLFYSEQIDKSSGEAVVLFFANILHSSKQIQSQIMKGADIVTWWKWVKLMLLNICEFLNSSQFWCTKSLSYHYHLSDGACKLLESSIMNDW